MKKLLFILTIVIAVLVVPSTALAKEADLKKKTFKCLAKPKGAEADVLFSANFYVKKVKSTLVVKKIAYKTKFILRSKSDVPRNWSWRAGIGLQPKYLRVIDRRQKGNLPSTGVIRPNWRITPMDSTRNLQVVFSIRWTNSRPTKEWIAPPNRLPINIVCKVDL